MIIKLVHYLLCSYNRIKSRVDFVVADVNVIKPAPVDASCHSVSNYCPTTYIKLLTSFCPFYILHLALTKAYG